MGQTPSTETLSVASTCGRASRVCRVTPGNVHALRVVRVAVRATRSSSGRNRRLGPIAVATPEVIAATPDQWYRAPLTFTAWH